MTDIKTDQVLEKSATFILFSTDENLTRTELNKAFRVKKGRLISMKGKFWQTGNLFDKLIAIKNSIPDEGIFFNFDFDRPVTHIYIVAQRSCTTSFALLKYYDQFRGGFDVSPSALEELQDLMEDYGQVASFYEFFKATFSRLNSTANEIGKKGRGVSSTIEMMCCQLEVEFTNFAKPNLELAKEKIDLWRDQHQWTHIDTTDKAQNDIQTPLAA